MLKPGTRAPEFVLPNEAGEDVALSDLLKDGPLLLYFYPADFTPVCTKQACLFRDMHDDIVAVGLRIAGVSPEAADSHRRFKREHELPFTLLCDTEKTAIGMYDVDGPFGVGVRRATYLINQDRRIQDAVTADVLIGRHREFLDKAIMLREAAGLRAGRHDQR